MTAAAEAEALKREGPAAAAEAVEATRAGRPTATAEGAWLWRCGGLVVEAGAAQGDDRMTREPAPLSLRQTVAAAGSGVKAEGDDGATAAEEQSKMFDPGGVQS